MGFEASKCRGSALNDTIATGELLRNMAAIADLTILGDLNHQFMPQGVTAILLVSESHLSAHTWPELGYAAVDVCSCKELDALTQQRLEAAVRGGYDCADVSSQLTHRGSGIGQQYQASPTPSISEREKRDEL